MAIGGRAPAQRLACGRRLSDLIDQVTERVPATDRRHQETCPHCGAALAELERLWGRVRELALEEVVAPYRVVQAVMQRVRAPHPAGGRPLALEGALTRVLRHALLHGRRGTTRVSDGVVASVAARAAREVHGVVELEGVDVDIRGAEVVVSLALVILFGANALDLAGIVRQLVIERVESLTGVAVLEVNVVVRGVAALQ